MRKQWRLFAEYWLKEHNATKAAIKAGYSPRSAHVQGSRMFKNDKVLAYIESRMKDLVMDADEAMTRLTRIARAEHAEAFEWLGQNYGYNMADVATKHAELIKKYKVSSKSLGEIQTSNIEIEWLDPQKALVDILKVHEKIKVSPSVNVTIEGFEEQLDKVYGGRDNESAESE